jgi:hypothetical protein
MEKQKKVQLGRGSANVRKGGGGGVSQQMLEGGGVTANVTQW